MSKYSDDKKKAIKIITDCAKKYQKNLLGKSLLFVCTDKHKEVSFFEIQFEAGNFMHLTGCHPVEKPVREESGNIIKYTKMSAPDFLQHCLHGRLREEDFEFSDNHTTPMKLEILSQLMEKDISANQIGEYNNNGLLLKCDKVAGSVKACLGVKKLKSGVYVAQTALNGDVRNYTKMPLQIIITYSKSINDERYSRIVRVSKAKQLDWSRIKFPPEYEYLPRPE